jgi:GNAT superfamily N-acetyltransferase
VLIRDRRAGDKQELLDIARRVHVEDKYPLHLPEDDYENFLFAHETLGAWVAEDRDVVGQVALHPRSSAPVMELATNGLCQAPDRIGVVARLLVHPNQRRLGVGGQLLDHAAREAAALGLFPILDVVKDLADAVSLYERQGWLRIGEVAVTFRGGVTVEEYVYAAPLGLRPL